MRRLSLLVLLTLLGAPTRAHAQRAHLLVITGLRGEASYGTAFAVLRGGINHFQLPASWDLVHPFAVLPVEDWPAGLPRPEARGNVTVVGELCTPEDTLARDVRVERVRAGDVVVFPLAGAYGWEFAMPNFLGRPPAWRAVADGS